MISHKGFIDTIQITDMSSLKQQLVSFVRSSSLNAFALPKSSYCVCMCVRHVRCGTDEERQRQQTDKRPAYLQQHALAPHGLGSVHELGHQLVVRLSVRVGGCAVFGGKSVGRSVNAIEWGLGLSRPDATTMNTCVRSRFCRSPMYAGSASSSSLLVPVSSNTPCF